MRRQEVKPVKRALLLGVVVVAGCSHPPRLDNEVANRHRAVVGSGTPTDREDELEGVLTTSDGKDRKDDLASLAKRAKAGDTIDVKLAPGVYSIEAPIVVHGAKLVIRGPGADLARIQLKSDDWRALTVEGSPSFELRGVTIAGFTGGGVDARNCTRVVVNECDFAGSRYGLELKGCETAYVDSCVFVGCYKAITLEKTHLVLRGTAISECWTTLEGSGVIEAHGTVIAGNVDGAKLKARAGSRFRSCLFGRMETFDVVGAIDVRSSYLFDDLYERFHLMADADQNVVLRELGDFPRAADIPRGCDLGAIHYAIERLQSRGVKDPNESIRDVLEAEARFYAEAAQRAIAGKDVRAAKWLQQLALDYLQAVGGGEEALRAQILGSLP
jgi:hypothetical protein